MVTVSCIHDASTGLSIIQCMQRSDEENIIHPGAEDLSFVLAHLQSKK